MTRQEAIKMLANTKVYVDGKSREIQEKLFSLGFHWTDRSKQVLFEKKPFLFLWEDMDISYSDNTQYFTQKLFREITADDILSIVIDEPKYRPFKDVEECFKEMKKHEPFGWIYLADQEPILINHVTKEGIIVGDRLFMSFKWALIDKHTRFDDGTPFGIKED